MKRIFVAAVFAAQTLAVSPATAHAFLDHASPPVGSTVHAPPAEVTLWFTQELEPAFSTVSVSDASGKRVDKRDVKVDGAVARVSLSTLDPGRYKVAWRALSVDTHVTEGDFTFEVVR
jgi:copper resistance protein C